MNLRPELKLDWCSHTAAKYAVEHWHYSAALPTPPFVRCGVWEAGHFIGCLLFSRGSNNNGLRPYGLSCIEGAELTRVALQAHVAPVSQMLAIAVRLVKKAMPGLRLLLSYADPNHGHAGGIYQAAGWIYTGQTAPDCYYVDRVGHRWHSRQVSVTGVKRQYGELRRVPRFADCVKVPLLGKHRYLYPLDAAMRQQLAPLARPYPKRPTSIGSDASLVQGEEGSAMLTVGLVARAESV